MLSRRRSSHWAAMLAPRSGRIPAVAPVRQSGVLVLWWWCCCSLPFYRSTPTYLAPPGSKNPVGSHMEMTGPKRGILVLSDVLMEFDMRIKTGEKEEHDLQLIDGVVVFSQRISTRPFTLRYNGTNGAVDMGLTLVDAGMETTIEVIVSEVQRAFHLSLSSFVSFTEELQEFQLFHGTIGELVTKRYVVAVPMETVMHLKLKVGEKGSGDAAHYCSFNSKHHGCVHREIKLDMATILVKVTVSAPL